MKALQDVLVKQKRGKKTLKMLFSAEAKYRGFARSGQHASRGHFI